jgi:glycosyltransferase involved in cell wall biosynthesis
MAFHPLNLVRAGTSPLTEAKTIAALTARYFKLKPTLVHHSTIKANVYGSLAARAIGVRAVVNTVTGLGYALMSKPDDRLPDIVRRRVAEALYATALTGVTVFQNSDQRQHFVEKKWVRAEQTRLIRGAGVDLKRFAPSPLPKEDVCLLPARMLYDKGVGEFVEAAKRLKGRARFVLVGAIDHENKAAVAQRQLDEWCAEGVVEWWGHRSDMPAVFAQATVVVLPSYSEGLPLALAEAQACGRPCITTLAPGCRESIEDTKTGLLVPVRDAAALAAAIDSVLQHRPRLEQMATAARAFAERHFSIASIVEQTLEACRAAGAPL